jgi:hypothetical protein
MKLTNLNKKLVASFAIVLSSLFFASFANAQDVSYASAGPGGATSYSASDNSYLNNGYIVNGYGNYGTYGNFYGYGNDCCNNGCGQSYGCGTSIQSIPIVQQVVPVIQAVANPCINTINSLGFRHHRFW